MAPHEPRRCSPEWVMRGYATAALFLFQVHCDALDDLMKIWCEALSARPR